MVSTLMTTKYIAGFLRATLACQQDPSLIWVADYWLAYDILMTPLRNVGWQGAPEYVLNTNTG